MPDKVGYIWNTLAGRSMIENEEMFFWEERQMDVFEYLAQIENKG